MASIVYFLNRLLPFATPGTPLVQDLVHLASICLLLYFAPHIQEWAKPRLQRTSEALGSVIDSQTIDLNDYQVQPEANGNPRGDGQQHDEARPQIANGSAIHGDQERPTAETNRHAQRLDNDDDDDDDDDDEDDEERHQQRPDDLANGITNRNVGAKKAKSLARKDQKRAYNEFMRSQGDAQRARDAEGATEREALLEVEKKRRALAEAELDAKKTLAREQKREAEKAEREADSSRRETAVAIVKADLAARNLSDLHNVARQLIGDVGEDWVEKVINASGLIGKKGDTLTMITSTGWVARITEENAREAYRRAIEKNISDAQGYIIESKFSELFASALSDRNISAMS